MDPFSWFLAAFAAVFLVVGFIPMTRPQDATKAALKDFQFPRSNEGDCVGLVYGTVKLRSPNTAWTGDFEGKAQTKKVATGIFTKKRVVVGYDYYIGMQLALCLGPNVRVRRIWFGKYLAWTGTLAHGGSVVINNLNLFGGPNKNGGVLGTVYFYGGENNQAQDAYLVANLGANVPKYNGIAHMVFCENTVSNRGFYFGKSTQIEPVSCEVDCFSNLLGLPDNKHIMSNGKDMNPAAIIYDLMVNDYARLGIPADRVFTQSFIDCGLTLWNEDHFMSLQVSQSSKGGELIAELLKQINGTIYQDPQTGQFVMALQRQDYDKLDLPEIDVDNLSEIANYTRNLWPDTINQVRVVFQNRDNDYMDNSPAMWQDMGNISATGRVRSTSITHPGCYDADLATFLATRNGAALSIPLFSADVKMNRAVGQTLRPNGLFRLTCRRLGIKKLVMRVREVDLGELTDGTVTVSAFQDIYASKVVTMGSPTGSQWEAPNTDPLAIASAAVIGAPWYFAAQLEDVTLSEVLGDGVIWVLPRAPNAGAQAFSAYTSTDAFVTNVQMVDNVPYQGSALLEAAYAITTANSDGFDNSGTGIIVYSLDGAYTPQTVTDGDIQSTGANLLLVGSEIIAYRTVTSLGGGRYRLTNLRRAMFDTTFQAHSADAVVYFLSSADGMSDGLFAASYAGNVRLTDLATGGGYPLESAADIAFSMDSRSHRPAPPTYVTIGGVRQPATVTNSTSPAIDILTRNRLTSGPAFFNDSSDTAEAGTDYRMQWRVNGGSYTVVDPWTPGSTITLGVTTGLLEIEVWSRRDGLLSRVSTKGTSTVV